MTGVGCPVVVSCAEFGSFLFVFVYLSKITKSTYEKIQINQTGLYAVKTAWPGAHRVVFAIRRSRVGVPLQPLAEFIRGISKFRYPVMLVNSQLVASCQLGFLILLCSISSINKQLNFHMAGMITLKLTSPPQQNTIVSVNSFSCVEYIDISFDPSPLQNLLFLFKQVQQANVDDEEIARAINSKLGETPGISYSEIASKAVDCGRTHLAIKVS